MCYFIILILLILYFLIKKIINKKKEEVFVDEKKILNEVFSKNLIPKNIDTIIIGSGISGLACGS
jgi:hypothetical protein